MLEPVHGLRRGVSCIVKPIVKGRDGDHSERQGKIFVEMLENPVG